MNVLTLMATQVNNLMTKMQKWENPQMNDLKKLIKTLKKLINKLNKNV